MDDNPYKSPEADCSIFNIGTHTKFWKICFALLIVINSCLLLVQLCLGIFIIFHTGFVFNFPIVAASLHFATHFIFALTVKFGVI